MQRALAIDGLLDRFGVDEGNILKIVRPWNVEVVGVAGHVFSIIAVILQTIVEAAKYPVEWPAM